ncbi:MAG: ATP-dependent DNA helicase [Clostridia bacterium]|nr:ATP-dependent DNA helicase [Clostridia bacterium]
MRYNTETAAVELSVRELCAMAHKSGHLDARRPPKSTALLQKGSEAHRRLQSREGPHYRAEVPLCNTTLYEGLYYTVTGRADGVLEEDGKLTVEEIKTVRGQGACVRDDAYSQLRCYAYFLCESRHLPRVRMRMRLFDPDRDTVRDHYSEMSAEELRRFYHALLARIAWFAEFEMRRKTEYLPSVDAIGFPYENPREGQTELAETVFRTVRKGKRLFAQAPTGIGKTMSTLYPAVKALGAGHCDRIFYLTAKASTRREAYAAAAKIFSVGGNLRTVVLYAKEQLCSNEGGCKRGTASRCNPDECPYARGYYDRVDGALKELLGSANGFPRILIEDVAKRHRICPYELSLDLALLCEIIICDYNYVFDPTVYLRRFFDENEGERGEYVFLVDEAHNLPDRARDMYSADLTAAPFEAVYARVDPVADDKLEEALGGFVTALSRMALLCTENHQKHEDGTESGYYLNREPSLSFQEQADLCRRALVSWTKANPDHPLVPELDELVATLKRFVGIAEYYDTRFLTFAVLCHGAFSLKLYCLDPAGVLHSAANRAKAAVFFSATLTPLDYFVDVMGGGKGALTLALPSPYAPENLSLTVVPSISTRMEDREKSYKRVATYIAAAVSARAGNYMVYFPSYDYLDHVYEKFIARYPHVTCIVQRPGMSAREREQFLASFKADEGHLRVGFCVLGGSFSEGVDLPGSRLIGSIIVGVGIPGLSNERNILRDYYENKCERGYDYAYTYPGMNRVLQAAGRVIRREEDKGVVVLIDSRYAEEPYLHLYPAHWQGITAAGDAASLAHRVARFWEDAEN